MNRHVISLAALAAAIAAHPAAAQQAAPAPAAASTAALTAAQADAFVAAAEKELAESSVEIAQISWINATYITDDTDALAAKAGGRFTERHSVRSRDRRRRGTARREDRATWRAWRGRGSIQSTTWGPLRCRSGSPLAAARRNRRAAARCSVGKATGRGT